MRRTRLQCRPGVGHGGYQGVMTEGNAGVPRGEGQASERVGAVLGTGR